MSTTAVFLDVEKAFDTTWHNGLLYILYKLSEINFSASLFKLVSSFLSNRKFCFAKDNNNRDSTMFRPVLYTVSYVCK
jgi:hypothetical protein